MKPKPPYLCLIKQINYTNKTEMIMKVKKNIAISDSGFVFNPSTGDSYSVNPIGLEILELLKDGKDDEFIIDYISQNYMIDKSSIEKDIYDFKNMLETYKIVQ